MTISYFKPGPLLTFQSVVSIRAKLNTLIQDPHYQGVCLDLSEVSHCDSAGLALIIEARKLCNEFDKQFEMKGISAETQSLAEFCGLKSILDSA